MEREYMTRHHLTPETRGGKDRPSNICRLWWDKHASLHKLFKLKTLDEILNLLRLQVQQSEEFGIPLRELPVRTNGNAIHWQNVFGDKSVPRAIQVLSRLKRFKNLHVGEGKNVVVPLGMRSRKKKRKRSRRYLRRRHHRFFFARRGG